MARSWCSLPLSLALVAFGLACKEDEPALPCDPSGTPAAAMSLDAQSFPEIDEAGCVVDVEEFGYSGECELVALTTESGTTTLELSCPHADAGDVPVYLSASTDTQPANLEVGETLTLGFFLANVTSQGGDTIPIFRSCPNYVNYTLSDADGPILGYANGNANGHYEYPPMTFDLLFCDPDATFGDDAPGHWQVATAAETIAVAQGYAERVGDGEHVWLVSNYSSGITCCHSNYAGFSFIRQ